MPAGPGVLATDALIGNRGELAALSDATYEAFDRLLPPHWSHNNPVDILGDAEPGALRAGAGDCRRRREQRRPAGHPDAAGDDRSDADRRGADSRSAKDGGKPIIASWMGGADVAAGEAILTAGRTSRRSRIPTPRRAIFTHMWRYSDNLRALYETPSVASDFRARRRRPPTRHRDPRDRPGRRAHAAHRVRIEAGARRLRHSDRRDARRGDAQTRRSPPRRRIGYPVVLKLHSETITHKTDVGGVALNLRERRRGAPRVSTRSAPR